MNKIISLFFGLLIILLGYGCSPAGILASGAATTMVIAEDDRSAGEVIDDATIKVKISALSLSITLSIVPMMPPDVTI